MLHAETVAAPAAPARRTLEYRPALDGMRGIAVAGVIAFHLGHLQGGFLGVDLFFTLSGYLITRLLLLEHESTGRVALGAFWARRSWRLLPALYLLLAALAVYAALFARPDQLDGIRGPGIAALLFVANWWFIASDQGYWDLFTAPSPLEHVWSLAIEQQFYVVWPLLVVALVGARHRLGRLLTATIALVAGSTVLLAVQAGDNVSRAYFGSEARAGSILVGAALAIVVQRGDAWVGAVARSRAGVALGTVAVLFIGWSWVAINGATDVGWYRGGFLAHAVAVAVVIALLTHRPTGAASRVLSFGPLRELGVVSYGLYLWHWPVIVVLDAERTGLTGATLLLTRLAVSLALTVASYVLVEQPARRRLARRASALVTFPAVGALVALALFVATVAPATEPVIGAAPPPRSAVVATPDGADSADLDGGSDNATQPMTDVLTDAASADRSVSGAIDGDPAVAPVDEERAPGPQSLLRTMPAELPTLRTPTPDDPLRALLVGDSYMFDASPGIAAALRASELVEPVERSWYGLSLAGDDWEQPMVELVESSDPELVVAMWGAFDAAWLGRNDATEYLRLLDRAIEILTANGAVVAFVGFAPSLSVGVDRVPLDRDINELFAALPTRHPGKVVYVDPDPIVAPDGEPDRWLDTTNGRLLVRKVDVSHYCGDGAARFGIAIGELIARMAGVPPAPPGAWWAGDWRDVARYDEPVGACAP